MGYDYWQKGRDLPRCQGGSVVCDVRLATRITSAVDRRLRMLALIEKQPLSHLLSALLDEALPAADELAGRLGEPSEATS
jgi:hypothetical protein